MYVLLGDFFRVSIGIRYARHVFMTGLAGLAVQGCVHDHTGLWIRHRGGTMCACGLVGIPETKLHDNKVLTRC